MGDEEKESDFEIYDVENYKSDKFQVFNHQILVMEVLRKANEAGSHELRAGWFNEKLDHSGNVIRTYIEDTRKRFVETVKTAIAVMVCDFDAEAKENIGDYIKDLGTLKGTLLKGQWDWYVSLPPKMKMQYSGKVSQIFFNMDLGWYLKFIEDEVDVYRDILEELHSLTKRLDFYQIEDFEV